MESTLAPASGSPATLVAIIRAARLTGDRYLEEVARQALREQFGIRVYFDDGKDSDCE